MPMRPSDSNAYSLENGYTVIAARRGLTSQRARLNN